jgi:hypothetical protein
VSAGHDRVDSEHGAGEGSDNRRGADPPLPLPRPRFADQELELFLARRLGWCQDTHDEQVWTPDSARFAAATVAGVT